MKTTRRDFVRHSTLLAAAAVSPFPAQSQAQTSEPDRGDLLGSFGAFLQDLLVFQEIQNPSRFAVETGEFTLTWRDDDGAEYVARNTLTVG